MDFEIGFHESCSLSGFRQTVLCMEFSRQSIGGHLIQASELAKDDIIAGHSSKPCIIIHTNALARQYA
jgi:hypothetical protein